MSGREGARPSSRRAEANSGLAPLGAGPPRLRGAASRLPARPVLAGNLMRSAASRAPAPRLLAGNLMRGAASRRLAPAVPCANLMPGAPPFTGQPPSRSSSTDDQQMSRSVPATPPNAQVKLQSRKAGALLPARGAVELTRFDGRVVYAARAT